jgi:hypothetical protein
MPGIKTLSRYAVSVLCLVCLAGIGQVQAVDTIQENWSLYQDVNLTPQGYGFIRQVIVGWGLEEVGTNRTASIMDSFKNMNGTMAINQVSGDLNNLACQVLVNQGLANGSSPLQGPLYTSSVISDNILRNYNSTYKVVIGGGSFEACHGVMAVTQIAGNMNNISNIVGFTTKGAGGMALSNATLSDINASNNVYQDLGVTRAAVEIQSDSFKGFTGVGSVIQAAGNMIQISTRLSVKVNQ